MSDSQASKPRSGSREAGILAGLSNTRPQRPSARRAGKPVPKPLKATPKATKTPKRARAQVKPLAPRQGFEAGSEIELGRTVGPPSGIELAGSVVGLLGEAAQAGLSSGGRLLKGAVSRLPGL